MRGPPTWPVDNMGHRRGLLAIWGHTPWPTHGATAWLTALDGVQGRVIS